MMMKKYSGIHYTQKQCMPICAVHIRNFIFSCTLLLELGIALVSYNNFFHSSPSVCAFTTVICFVDVVFREWNVYPAVLKINNETLKLLGLGGSDTLATFYHLFSILYTPCLKC